MKKYYIATSTLNFNNILSSESISPKSFYESRNFGYQRWTEIHENVNNNIIILYNNPFSFTRPASDMEDHPMLIEIKTDNDFVPIDNGVYYCDKTIYLSPLTSRFIFFNETDRKVTLSISDSSIETKLIKIYNKCIEADTSLPLKESLFSQKIEKECNSANIEDDKKINKMKGLLYGYYIGGYLSEDDETVKKRNDFQYLLELISAIRSRCVSVPTKEELGELEQLLLSVQSNLPKFKEFINLKNDVESAFPNKHTTSLRDYEQRLKKDSGFIDAEEILPLIKEEIDITTNTTKPNQAIEWLRSQKEKFEKLITHTPLSIDTAEIVIVDKHLAKIQNDKLNSDDMSLFLKWVNEVLCEDKYNSKISTYNQELSTTLTIKAKESLDKKWDSSKEKVILNNIRKYIADHDVEISWGNDLYSSLVAVLKEGNDWEKLLYFMQRKGITDYRLAFAIYGELNGFADLPRDFTDVLFELEDKKYIESLYQKITRQLHGEQFKTKDLDSATSQSTQKEITIISSQKKERENNIEYNFVDMMIKEIKQKLSKEFIKILKELYTECNGNVESFSTKVKRIDKNFNGKKAVLEFLDKKMLAKYPNLFDEQLQNNSNEKYFYNDEKAWNLIEELIPFESREEMKNDFLWFQSEIKKEPKKRNYYQNIKAQNNQKVIEAFCRLHKNQRPKYFTQELREKVKQKLLEYYDEQNNNNN